MAGYAVAYVIADAEMKVTLALSSNDQGKAWLNGKEVFKFAETRTLEKDTDRSGLADQRPERPDAQGHQRGEQLAGLRTFPQGRRAVKNIKVSLAPQ